MAGPQRGPGTPQGYPDGTVATVRGGGRASRGTRALLEILTPNMWYRVSMTTKPRPWSGIYGPFGLLAAAKTPQSSPHPNSHNSLRQSWAAVGREGKLNDWRAPLGGMPLTFMALFLWSRQCCFRGASLPLIPPGQLLFHGPSGFGALDPECSVHSLEKRAETILTSRVIPEGTTKISWRRRKAKLSSITSRMSMLCWNP